MSGVTYGAFDLDAHATPPVGYYVIGRPLGTVQIQQVLTPVARYEGVKVNGQFTGQKPIKLAVKVVGSSRSSLESMLDAMYQALNTPLQKLKFHTGDTRYFLATAVFAPADMSVGELLAKTVLIDFISASPYALTDSTSTYDSGVQTLAASGGAYPYSFSVTGNGTVFSRPTVQVFNRRANIASQLTASLVSGTSYTTLTVTALSQALYAGDTLVLTDIRTPPMLNPASQTVTVTVNASAGDTTIHVASFIANYSYTLNTGGFNPEYTTVVASLAWQSVTLQQTVDSQYWSVSAASNPGIASLCAALNENLLFTSDPNVGISVVDSAVPATLLNFSGSPITLNPASTPYILTISSLSLPIVEVVYSWQSRWLS